MFSLSTTHLATYFLTLIFSFLGLYVGAMLAFIAPEEIKSGRVYFRTLQAALIVLIAGFLLRCYGASWLILLVVGAMLCVLLYFVRQGPVAQIAYCLFGIAFFFASQNYELFTLVASLIFLFGVPVGTLYAYRHLSASRSVLFGNILLSFGLFFVLALLSNLIAMFVAVSA